MQCTRQCVIDECLLYTASRAVGSQAVSIAVEASVGCLSCVKAADAQPRPDRGHQPQPLQAVVDLPTLGVSESFICASSRLLADRSRPASLGLAAPDCVSLCAAVACRQLTKDGTYFGLSPSCGFRVGCGMRILGICGVQDPTLC
jgi:hypothetical protein